jgi:hypothetical protein
MRGQSLSVYLPVHLSSHARAPDLDASATPQPNFGREMNRLYATYLGLLDGSMILLAGIFIAIARL